VAIKVLPQSLVADPDRVARFEREARALASLAHPNVAALFEVGRQDGVRFLVMELAPGETLAARISRGPLPVREALPIALQIAEALEAAHDHGIVHRDLKPANVMVGAEERVKVLDFGLAKALEPGSGTAGAADLAHSPTLTAGATVGGVLLGTAGYMSPEQARGRPADRRSDVWAFGVVLLEMLTGRSAFAGETLSDTLAAVLRGEPDLAALPPGVPAVVRRLLARCLRKEPRRRLQAIGDARVVLEDALAGVAEDADLDAGRKARRAGWRRALPWAIATVAIAVAVFALFRVAPSAERGAAGPRRLSIFGLAVGDTGVAISPDGRQVVAADPDPAAPRLLRRRLDSFETEPIAGTENGFNPFFSPDGGSVGFFAAQRLCVVPAAGGPRRCLADAAGLATGSWGPSGTIVFSHQPTDAGGGLLRIAVGGAAGSEWLTRVDSGAGERAHGYPQVLPDGRHVLFTAFGRSADSVVVVPLTGGEPRVVLRGARRGRSVGSGHLVYVDSGTGAVYAAPFDLARLAVVGEGVEVLRGSMPTSDLVPAFEVSEEGTLIYSGAAEADDALTVDRVDRSGRTETLIEAASWICPRVSADGSLLLLRRVGLPDCHLWLFDLERRALTRMTDQGDDHLPLWSPDGGAIIFSRSPPDSNERQVFAQSLDGGPAAPIDGVPRGVFATAVSFDGRYLTLEPDDRSARDILVHDRETGATEPWLATAADERDPAFSPDGRFLAYTSNETGRAEVYVRPFPGPGRKQVISTAGGGVALWSRQGRELFYVQGATLMRVPVTADAAFTAGSPEPLFTDPLVDWNTALSYDVMPDGDSFVVVRRRPGNEPVRELRVVLDWFAELERLAPRRDDR
jgi:eukaryotic-like serine/threonine-protein kinase